MSGKVYIVHAIDTEGPLHESVSATFERLSEIFGIDNIPATEAALRKMRKGEYDFGEKTQLIMEALSAHRVSTLGSWDKIDAMLDEVTSYEYRMTLPDTDGNGWVFNWFCLDHVGFINNPRRRDMGFHNIHDHYVDLINSQHYSRDTIEWHFHPISTYRDAHRCATHYLRSNEIYQILCRRIIERRFFPSCYRAGFQAERPDSHWFLEQFIPFDISNMSTKDTTDIDNSIDFRNGRSGNWRQAPYDWSVYHPSHDNYQIPGDCRRLIGRALNLRNRIGNMTQNEMDNAFRRAAEGMDTLVGLCSHDWRDLRPELECAREFISNSSAKYPEVSFYYSQADEAFYNFADAENKHDKPIKMEILFHPEKRGEDVPYIEIKVIQGRVFGPQPFLAIKTKSQQFIHDNLDFSSDGSNIWYYAFHGDTLPLDDVECLGVAANDFLGNTDICLLYSDDLK